MSQSGDDAPTGPIAGRPQPASAAGTARIRTAGEGRTRRRSVVGDVAAVALLVVAVLLPWNLYFGLGIPGSSSAVFAALLAVTLLSVVSVAVAGSWRPSGGSARLRLALNAPYLLLVLAFVGFDVFETVRWGGTVNVPGGVGPGAWLGVAGALLAVRTPVTEPGADGRRSGSSGSSATHRLRAPC